MKKPLPKSLTDCLRVTMCDVWGALDDEEQLRMWCRHVNATSTLGQPSPVVWDYDPDDIGDDDVM